MQSHRSNLVWLFAIALVALAQVNPAQAWYGHRNNRSYRSNRMSQRMAALSKATRDIAAAQAKLAVAKVNAARQIRQARYQAQHSSGLVSAKSADLQANRDYQAAGDAVIAKLKTTNPEFRDLLDQASAKRERFATLAKTGESPEEQQRLSSELRTIARKVTLIEDQAVESDPTARKIAGQKPDIHGALETAEKTAQLAVTTDPGVQSSQRQLSQAALQAQQASVRYGNALNAASASSFYGRGRSRGRHGYRVYMAMAGYTHAVHHPHHHHFR